VGFAPDDHVRTRGAPEVRRRFLVEVFTDACPGYAEVLARYEKALKSRNRILKQMKRHEEHETLSTGLSTGLSTAELESWTGVLATAAVQLSQLKDEVWPRFAEHFLDHSRRLFDETGLELSLRFAADRPKVEGRASQAADFIDVYRKSWTVDKATGWTHRGPHRDDFVIELSGLSGRSKASQGQARLLALGLKWAHASWVQQERGEIPLFLIDDFSNELDGLRRKKLLEILAGIPGQVFITGTDSGSVDSGVFSEYRHYEVLNGQITGKNDL